MRLTNYTIILGVLLGAGRGQAQTASPRAVCADPIQLTSSPLDEPQRSLLRALSITAKSQQSYLFRASSMPATVCADGFDFLARWRPPVSSGGITVLPVFASLVTNSAYPRSVNDAGGWNGKGLNLAATAGVSARWRFLNAQLAPEFFHQQNSDFIYIHRTGAGLSEYTNPFRGSIDYPTRFGAKSFSTLTPGQSFIQATYSAFSATVGTENLWIGAADQFPILMSYTAPGFPHVRIGTQRPVNAWIANIEFQMLFGSLHESDYFDTKSENDSHYFTATMITAEPRFLPGLYLSVARAYHDTVSAGGHRISYYLNHLIETPFGGLHSGNDAGNAIGILLARWVLPESGFEAFAEWSREDTPGDFVDVLREPDWTQAYSLGFAKTYARPNRLIRFYGELTHLGESAASRSGRGFFSYYTHSRVTQGHTNEGQILGASIGPGSDVDLLGVDVYTASGRTKIQVDRTRYDNDTYYRSFARRYGESRHDAEITLLGSHLRFVGPLEVEGGLQYSRRYGRGFIPLPAEQPDLVENNWSVRLSGAWRPKLF